MFSSICCCSIQRYGRISAFRGRVEVSRITGSYRVDRKNEFVKIGALARKSCDSSAKGFIFRLGVTQSDGVENLIQSGRRSEITTDQTIEKSPKFLHPYTNLARSTHSYKL